MIDNERMIRLQAAELHEAGGDTGEIQVDIFPHKDGNFTAAIRDVGWSVNKTDNMLLLSDEWGEILIFADELEIVTALLQRAKKIMGGGA